MTPCRRATSVLLLAVSACGPRVWEPVVVPAEAIPPAEEGSLLRGHLRSGGLVILSSWEPPAEGSPAIEGLGTRYGADNEVLEAGRVRVPLDSVVLWASEDPHTVARGSATGLGVWSAIAATVTAVCVADPKSCFGSCPTFYVDGNEGETLVAEGFSSSFARVLEETDVDVIPELAGPSRGSTVSLIMRNEAPETHAVRSARLLVAPRPPGAVLLATDAGALRVVRNPVPPLTCDAPSRPSEPDCLSDVVAADDHEYLAPADSTDLAAREVMTLEFDPVPEATDGGTPSELGLVIQARNSLLTTYVFYQTIAFLGSRAEHWLAELERGSPAIRERALGPARALGSVEVLLQRNGRWEAAGAFGEAGPITGDVQVIPLGRAPAGPVRVALRMARGNWRIDRVALARLGAAVEPTVLDPVRVEPLHGELPAPVALARLADPDAYLVTRRGDAYRLVYELPASSADTDIFLESRGYYYEWMRPEWLAEEDPAMAALMFADPALGLRRLAPGFKAREAHMEEVFWSSRFRREVP